MNNPMEFPASHPQNNRGTNNACDHDVPYFNFMGVQDPPPLPHECFVCQRRGPICIKKIIYFSIYFN